MARRLSALLGLFAVTASLVAVAPAPASAAPRYHLSVGDSLARGVQPGPTGAIAPTGQGYGPIVARSRRLRLVELGCPGETVGSMVRVRRCRYEAGSQLRAAEAFLRRRRGQVALVTVSIGANDVVRCGSPASLDLGCAAAGATRATRGARSIALRLRRAAGRRTRIVGLTYYNPFLALYLRGADGPRLALAAAASGETLNAGLRLAYGASGVRVANVDGAFGSADVLRFEELPGVGAVPVAVARVCRLTYACVAPPQGPDVHPNAEGYRVIAGAVGRAAR